MTAEYCGVFFFNSSFISVQTAANVSTGNRREADGESEDAAFSTVSLSGEGDGSNKREASLGLESMFHQHRHPLFEKLNAKAARSKTLQSQSYTF